LEFTFQVVDLAFGHSCAARKDMKRKRKQKGVEEARNKGQEFGDLASHACHVLASSRSVPRIFPAWQVTVLKGRRRFAQRVGRDFHMLFSPQV
jgi:hypothetical protein